MCKSRVGRWLAVCSVSLLIMMARGSAQEPASHSSPLGSATFDTLPNGDVVMSFVATGDLRGLITLTLHPSANGSYAGEWAFTVAHADNTDPTTGIDPDLAEGADDGGSTHPDQGFLRLVQQGSLQGTVVAATPAVDASGALTDLSATLSIDAGAGEFDGVTGSGQATLASLTLNF